MRMWSQRVLGYKFTVMGGLYDQFRSFMGGFDPEE